MPTPVNPNPKRRPVLPPSTRNALFYTFLGVANPPEDPLPPKGDPPPLEHFLYEWQLPPAPNRFNLILHRYHRLWADTINELDHGFSTEAYQSSYVEGYFWSEMEKRRFFAALDICGPQDPAGIQQRIGPTKTVYQVQLYINLLQRASDENPVSEGTDSTDDDTTPHPYAHEMSPSWIQYEEQQAQFLSTVLDNEVISLDQYHRFGTEQFPPEMMFAKMALDKEVLEAQELIDPIALYEWAARDPFDGMAPPTMTLESQIVLYRLLRKFVADVMTGVILSHRRQFPRQNKVVSKNTSTNSALISGNCDIFEADIEAALCDYYDSDEDIDMDMTTDDDLTGMDDSETSDSDPDSGSGSDSDSGSDSGSDSDGSKDLDNGVAKLEDDSDGSVSEDSSSDGDADRTKSKVGGDINNNNNNKDDDDDDATDSMNQDLEEDIRMQFEDRMYEQQLYHQINF